MATSDSIPTVLRNCPLCDCGDSSPVLEKADVRLVKCKKCSMVFANPIAAELVSGQFYDQLSTPFYLSPEKLAGDYAPVRFTRELRLFRRFCKTGRVLDVGCSTGAFLYQLKKRFAPDYEVLGTDVAGPALEYAAGQGVPVSKQSFLDSDSCQAKFAAVTFWAVLEHLPAPRPFLSRAADVLQPGGHCFVLVPNFKSLAVRLLGSRYRYILAQHVNYFTAATLAQLVKTEPRFRLVLATGTHFNPLVIYKDWRRGGAPVSDEARARLLARTTRYKQNPLLRPAKLALLGVEKALVTFDLADNLVAVLQKMQ